MEHGIRIYDLNATPTPTATPLPDLMSENSITPIRPEDTYLAPDSSMDSQVPGALAWDSDHSVFPSAMYQEDFPVVLLRFVSNVNYPISHERVVLKLERQDIFGGWWKLYYTTWNESITITKGKDLAPGQAPGEYTICKNFTSVFTRTNGKIPETWPVMGQNVDTAGRYRIQIWIYVPDSEGVESQACYISKQFQVIEKK
jgi:hypothetical protein